MDGARPSPRVASPAMDKLALILTVMAHVKLRGPAAVDPELFADWLAQARALSVAGGTRGLDRKAR
jgi:hypothetical protein